MKYRVFNKITKEDITEKYDWVVTPDGTLYINEWGDYVTEQDAVCVLEENVEAFLNDKTDC